MVASSATANASPRPNCRVATSLVKPKPRKMDTMMAAALEIAPAVWPTPAASARRSSPVVMYSALTRLSRNTS